LLWIGDINLTYLGHLKFTLETSQAETESTGKLKFAPLEIAFLV